MTYKMVLSRKKRSKSRKRRKPTSKRCAPVKSKPKAKRSQVEAEAARKHAKRRRKKCKPRKKRVKPRPVTPPTAAIPVVPVVPAAGQPAPPVPPPPPPPVPDGKPTSPIAMYTGTFGHAEASRLLHRAGFGPRPGEADRLAALGLRDAVATLTRPVGDAVLEGPAPVDRNGAPWDIDPVNVYEMDAFYWFDRMMRSSHQLVERMALILHDWFATSELGISQLFMLNQTNLFRKYCLGSFKDLVHDIGADPAMIMFLNQDSSLAGRPNENYARELMELFTMGVGGGYTESDIREAARALTGWTYTSDPETGVLTGFVVHPLRHDHGEKTIFGQTGNFDWEDVARLVTEHPGHGLFFVRKLWSYFIATPPTPAETEALAALYRESGHQIRPVLEAILLHPELYAGPAMIKPPVVYIAGMLRARARFITGDLWTANARLAGQRLYQPPDVGGWDDSRWLDSNTINFRWLTVYQMMVPYVVKPSDPYPADETPEAALGAALDFWGRPALRRETNDMLLEFATSCVPATPDSYSRGQRQNALRHLIAISPDYQAC